VSIDVFEAREQDRFERSHVEVEVRCHDCGCKFDIWVDENNEPSTDVECPECDSTTDWSFE
jgi:hypothetical protein